jgi:hypothetical protein
LSSTEFFSVEVSIIADSEYAYPRERRVDERMGDPNDKKPLPLNYSVPARFTIPRYRKILSGILVSAGVVLAIIALFATSDYERRGSLTVSFALIVWGVVIRFQHVGL